MSGFTNSTQDSAVWADFQSTVDATRYADKAAYLEACCACPEVVHTESNPVWFLEHANSETNCRMAVTRLCSYWSTRKKVFGERWLSSVSDLSSGALSDQALQLMEKGVGVFMPVKKNDKALLFLDRMRMSEEMYSWDLAIKQQLFFYLLQHVLMQQSRSMDVIFVVRSRSNFHFAPKMADGFRDFVKHVFPIHWNACHVVLHQTSPSAYRSLRKLMLPVVLKLVKRYTVYREFSVEVGDTVTLGRKLQAKGYHLEQLPETVNGKWTYDQYDEWFRQQLQHRQQRVVTPLQILADAVEQQTSSPPRTLSIALPTDTDSEPLSSPLSVSTAALKLPLADPVASNVDKTQFTKAVQQVPEIVQSESNPLIYRSVVGEEKSSQRLAEYWNLRVEIFGSQAFRPMQCSQGGCMSSAGVQASLGTGCVTLLPPDTKGRSVIVLDPSRLQDDHMDCLKCLFYMLHVALEDPNRSAVALLLVLNKLSFKRLKGRHEYATILSVFPISDLSIHIVRQPARLGNRTFDTEVVPHLRTLFSKCSDKIVTRSGNATENLKEILKRDGFCENNLPRSLGGGWTYQHFLQWKETRLCLEGVHCAHMNSRSPAPAGISTSSRPAAGPRTSPDNSAIMQQMLLEEQMRMQKQNQALVQRQMLLATGNKFGLSQPTPAESELLLARAMANGLLLQSHNPQNTQNRTSLSGFALE